MQEAIPKEKEAVPMEEKALMSLLSTEPNQELTKVANEGLAPKGVGGDSIVA